MTYTSQKPKMLEPGKRSPAPTEFWVYVKNDLTEDRYLEQPTTFKSLHVFVIKAGVRWYEQTATYSLPVREKLDGPVISMEPNRPPGVGWQLHTDNGDHAIGDDRDSQHGGGTDQNHNHRDQN